MKNLNYLLKDILFGVAVGDALGVPVEFKDRAYLKQNPITEMIGYGTYDQPKGTWSDDSSLTFCLAESINEGLDLQKLANKFVSWKDDNYWTPHGWVFDIGIATRIAIEKLAIGEKPELAGGLRENDNGNGSLMRILPLLIHIKDKPIKERFAITKQVSSLTHAHIRSVIACFYYLEFSRRITLSQNKLDIYKELKKEVSDFLVKSEINPIEIELFKSLLKDDIFLLEESEIKSSGYVLHTLEASIWCLLTTNTYSEAVLKAVNLGNDTDTTGAVTGGISALLYGNDAIPKDWINCLAKKNDILKLC